MRRHSSHALRGHGGALPQFQLVRSLNRCSKSVVGQGFVQRLAWAVRPLAAGSPVVRAPILGPRSLAISAARGQARTEVLAKCWLARQLSERANSQAMRREGFSLVFIHRRRGCRPPILCLQPLRLTPPSSGQPQAALESAAHVER